MIQHCVLITFVPEATAEQRQAVADALADLPMAIPEIISYRVGLDEGWAEGNASVGIVAKFSDKEAWQTYQDHPEHRSVIEELIAPIRQSRVAAQFEL